MAVEPTIPQNSEAQPSASASLHPPILIIGAGIVGLTIAQACRKHNVPYQLFERDPNAHHRGAGWGLTIYWALQDFYALLPQEIIDRLPEAFVDPEAVARGEKGNFTFYDLQTGAPKWRVPPSHRIRVARERLRRLLMHGIDIQWSKTLEGFETNADGATAVFKDGTTASGIIILGCDGSRSRVRQLLCPENYQNYQVPVKLLGVAHPYPAPIAQKMRDLDVYLTMGADPRTSAYLWFSFLDTPSNNDRAKDDTFMCNIITSWPFKKGFLGRDEPIDVPESRTARLALMKEISKDWTEPFRSILQDLPQNVEPKQVSVEDWPPGVEGRTWNNRNGRVTLVGDSAHPMTMYRGQGANHAFKDARLLLDQLFPALKEMKEAANRIKSVIDAYEAEMCERTRPAVLDSRQACLDAHQYEKLSNESPLVGKRI